MFTFFSVSINDFRHGKITKLLAKFQIPRDEICLSVNNVTMDTFAGGKNIHFEPLTAMVENIFRIGLRHCATPPNAEYIFSQLSRQYNAVLPSQNRN